MPDKNKNSSEEEIEKKRVEDLINYQILDTPEEKIFDLITKLSSAICHTPISLISFIDNSRHWNKSKVGIDIKECQKEISICNHTIKQNDILIVENTLEDHRFKDYPSVGGEGKIRFYAGVPLKTKSGNNIGTLCVIDIKPRTLTNDQKLLLKTLGEKIVIEVESRKNKIDLKYMNEKVNLLSQAKDNFLINMSHEIRTPLNAIYGFTELLTKSKVDEKQKEYISIIKSSVENLIMMINDIIDYSKMESGKLTIHRKIFSLEKAIKEIQDIYKVKANEKKINFNVEIDKKIPVYIKGDKIRLNQILSKLTDNAIKFTEKGLIELKINLINLNSEKNEAEKNSLLRIQV